MKEKLFELVVWGDMEEKGFSARIETTGTRPKSFTLTQGDEYFLLLSVVRAVAKRFDMVGGAVSTEREADPGEFGR